MHNNKHNIIITGANRGIGFGLAKQYAQQGHRVFALVRNLPNIEVENIEWLKADLTDETQRMTAVEKLLTKKIEIDFLINNAGITISESFGCWKQKSFSDSLLINTIVPALFIQAIEPILASDCKLIQLSSGLAQISTAGGKDPFCSYSMSKAAINMLTKKLAEEFRDTKRVVAAVSPGWVQTDMGGPDAPDTIEQAVQKLTKTFEKLTSKNSGFFFNELGVKQDW